MIMRYKFVFHTLHRQICYNSMLISKTLSSKVPLTPVPTLENLENHKVTVDTNTVALLERLSLVKLDTEQGMKVLEDSIAFADKILHINTDNVEPLYTVLENENLNLRSDEITQGNCRLDILKNASVKEDDYFVAPPGNIPLHEVHIEENTPKKLKEDEIKYPNNTESKQVF